MEKPIRTLAKAVSWQLLGMIVMVVIGYAFTGSVAAGGGIASPARPWISQLLPARTRLVPRATGRGPFASG